MKHHEAKLRHGLCGVTVWVEPNSQLGTLTCGEAVPFYLDPPSRTLEHGACRLWVSIWSNVPDERACLAGVF